MSPRRLLFLQIDGLSGRRLGRALTAGLMPELFSFLGGKARSFGRRTSIPPSTPAFHSTLMYGRQEIVHGFSWFDRERGIICRFDVPEDIAHVESQLEAASSRPPLLAIAAGSTTYFMTLVGGAARALLTLANGMSPARLWRTGLLFVGLLRTAFAAPGELARGIADLVGYHRRERTLRHEWNWLAMRVLYATAFEELSTRSVLADMLAGAPMVYYDFVAYDEASHRRGPDAPVSYDQLRRIDRRIGRLLRGARDRGYEVVLCSDHGQASALPFERIAGRSIAVLVFEACAGRPVDERFRTLAARVDEQRIAASRVRKWFDWVRWPLEGLARYHARSAARALEQGYGLQAGELAVVTGGSIAHVYLGRAPQGSTLEEIERRYPYLLPALAASRGIGLAVVRRSADGPLVVWRGQRFRLDDTAALAGLEPFVSLGVEPLRRLIGKVVSMPTAGDIVLYGAFAEAGSVSFDWELGSHGGIHPDELDLFVIQPEELGLPSGEVLDPAELNALLRARYHPEAGAGGVA